MLDHFPASDKSFSRLLGEAPTLPSSLLKLLDDLCYLDVSDYQGNSLRDADRVAQGLGSVWSLILGRPQYRESCLDIALKVIGILRFPFVTKLVGGFDNAGTA